MGVDRIGPPRRLFARVFSLHSNRRCHEARVRLVPSRRALLLLQIVAVTFPHPSPPPSPRCVLAVEHGATGERQAQRAPTKQVNVHSASNGKTQLQHPNQYLWLVVQCVVYVVHEAWGLLARKFRIRVPSVLSSTWLAARCRTEDAAEANMFSLVWSTY